MARRFIVNDEDIKQNSNGKMTFTGKEVKHIQVLRHNVEDEIIVNNGVWKIEKMDRDTVSLSYVKEAPIIGVPNTNVTLYMAFLKSDKMDFVVQKAVEIGVKKIVPFFSTNVVVKLDEKDKIKRKEKLQKIADEACKQCGRMDKVLVDNFISFNNLLNEIESQEKVFFAYEASHDSLRREINDSKNNNFKDIGVIIGAEGGFTSVEAEKLVAKEKVYCVSLGTRILRAETAALKLLSVVMYEMEE